MLCRLFDHFLGPKSSRTIFLKIKAIVKKKKRFWPIFADIIQHGRYRVTTWQAAQGSLTIFAQAFCSFFGTKEIENFFFKNKG